MIIFFDNDGRIIQTSESIIYQGDSAVGRIYAATPFPNNTALTASFTLPNGDVTPEYAFVSDISETGEDLGSYRPVIYKLAAPASVFSMKSGMIKIQFYAYTPIGGNTVNMSDSSTWSERKALDPTTLTVIQGNYVDPSVAPTVDQWTSILTALSSLSGDVSDLLGMYGLSVFTYSGVVATSPTLNGKYTYTNSLTVYYGGRTYREGQLIIDQLANLYVCIADRELIDIGSSSSIANGVQFVAALKGTQGRQTAILSYWTKFADDSNAPYTCKSNVVINKTLGNKTYVELINDNPIAFAKYGFVIGKITGQTVEVWALAIPNTVTLTFAIGGID